MTLEPASYPRHRFPAEIISHAVWLYHVFSLSLRDVELILAERGIVVTHRAFGRHPKTFTILVISAVSARPPNRPYYNMRREANVGGKASDLTRSDMRQDVDQSSEWTPARRA